MLKLLIEQIKLKSKLAFDFLKSLVSHLFQLDWVKLLAFMISFLAYMQSNFAIQESSRLSNIETRPRLSISFDSISMQREDAYAKIYDTLGGTPRLVDSALIGMFAVKTLIRFSNEGKLPLVVRKTSIGTLYKGEWFSRYSKSLDSLYARIIREKIYDSQDVDFPVIPGQSQLGNRFAGTMRPNNHEYFQDGLKCDTCLGSIDLYPYWFIEYEDPFGVRYNFIQVSYTRADYTFKKYNLTFTYSKPLSIERVGWDVGLPKYRVVEDSFIDRLLDVSFFH